MNKQDQRAEAAKKAKDDGQKSQASEIGIGNKQKPVVVEKARGVAPVPVVSKPGAGSG
jgi:hypothetical protein